MPSPRTDTNPGLTSKNFRLPSDNHVHSEWSYDTTGEASRFRGRGENALYGPNSLKLATSDLDIPRRHGARPAALAQIGARLIKAISAAMSDFMEITPNEYSAPKICL